MEIKNIEVSKIQFNDWNPNTMSQTMFGKLVNSIKNKGIQVPLLVMKSGRKFVLIDGEHRLTAAKQLSILNVDCVVLDKMSKTQAMMLNRHVNIIKGEDDDSKLNDFLRDLHDDVSLDTIIDELPYVEDEIISILDIKVDDEILEDDIALDEIDEEKIKEEKITLRFKVNQQVHDKWMNICENIKIEHGDFNLKPEKIFEILVNSFE